MSDTSLLFIFPFFSLNDIFQLFACIFNPLFSNGRKKRIGRSRKVNVDALIGGAFGSVYQVQKSTPILVEGGLILDMKDLQKGVRRTLCVRTHALKTLLLLKLNLVCRPMFVSTIGVNSKHSLLDSLHLSHATW